MKVEFEDPNYRSIYAAIRDCIGRNDRLSTIVQIVQKDHHEFRTESTNRLRSLEKATGLTSHDPDHVHQYLNASTNEATAMSHQGPSHDWNTRIASLEGRCDVLEEELRRISNRPNRSTGYHHSAPVTSSPIIETIKPEVSTASHHRYRRRHNAARSETKQIDCGHIGSDMSGIPSHANVASKARRRIHRDDLTIDGNPKLTGSGSTKSFRLVKLDGRWFRVNDGESVVWRAHDEEASLPRARAVCEHRRGKEMRSSKTVSFETRPKPRNSRYSIRRNEC